MNPRNQLGMTLVELMTVLAIIAFISLISLPNLYTWLPNHRLRSAARDLVQNFQLAKMTAVRTAACCTLVFGQSIGGKEYDYVVFQDTDNDLEYDSGERIIDRIDWSDYKDVSADTSRGGSSGVTFVANDDGKPAVAFMPTGLPVNNSGGFGAGSVFLINSVEKTASVVLSSAGNVRTDD